ncbi:hypothetical protein JIN85_19595 [Luteolibacter pohnpeiensis]|uniref:Uncharacterized protein n=2 Tax=Luteolibacter pohnpeiensis TaxID=454153 RepID=A0A934VXQ7_9BACT|nr:hypothetical protein [Luteolibacter pohnpeiensis]MBK1884630.1 hypothetical protein [Luteolibacter pohnpeiensis]
MSTGRPKMEFDLSEVEKLGMLGATAAEMAAWFGCATRTIERRMSRKDGEFCRSYEKGFGRLKISLRRQQIESAKGGNVSMLIWLGKQLLDQADKREVKEEATVTEKAAPLTLSPEDEEFLHRKRLLFEGRKNNQI